VSKGKNKVREETGSYAVNSREVSTKSAKTTSMSLCRKKVEKAGLRSIKGEEMKKNSGGPNV